MKVKFSDKVVIVTGASSGIGLAVVKEFASLGSKVVMASRNEEVLKSESQKIQYRGENAIYKVTDVSSESDCKALIDFTLESYGRIDILINNAGVSMRANFIDVDLSVLKLVMDVNFWGTVYCSRYALKELITRKGVIVGISSIAGFHGLPGRTGYSASKFAMNGFLESLRIEYFREGLKVFVIAPGFTSSKIRESALLADGTIQGISPRHEERMHTPEYVARWVIKGIKRKRRNKLLSWEGRLTVFGQRIIPRKIDWLIYRDMIRETNSPLKH